MSLIVGAAQDSFFEQAPPPSSTCRWAASIKVMLGFEHKRFKPPALNNMHATANWFEEIDTPEGQGVQERWQAKFPDEPYINDMGYNAYNALYMYKKLVEKAESTKLDGHAQGDRDGRGLHRCARRPGLHRSRRASTPPTACGLISVDAAHKVKVEQDLGPIKPYWLGEIGCDLTKKNDQGPVHAEQSSQEVVTRRWARILLVQSCSIVPIRVMTLNSWRRNDAAP